MSAYNKTCSRTSSESQKAERPHCQPKHTVCSLTRKTKKLQLWRENGENGWAGGSWVNANTQEVVFALKQCPPVCKMSPGLSGGVGGGEAGEGMQGSDNLPYACCSQRCQSFSARALCLLRGERVPFSADHKKGGGGCSPRVSSFQ